MAEPCDFLAFIKHHRQVVDNVAEIFGGKHDVFGHGGKVFIDGEETPGENDVGRVVDAVKEGVHHLCKFMYVVTVEGSEHGGEELAIEVAQHFVAIGLAGLDFFFEGL